MRRAPFTFLAAWIAASCGGSRTPPPEPTHPVAAPDDRTPDAGRAKAPGVDAPLPERPGRLWRRDVVAALGRGLGDLLRRAQVEPVLAAGKFRGWRIVQLQSGDPMWSGVDLAPGDVVTAVNDRPIERPEQAFAVFQSLAVAKELRVTYERDAKRRDLVYPIDDPHQP